MKHTHPAPGATGGPEPVSTSDLPAASGTLYDARGFCRLDELERQLARANTFLSESLYAALYGGEAATEDKVWELRRSVLGDAAGQRPFGMSGLSGQVAHV